MTETNKNCTQKATLARDIRQNYHTILTRKLLENPCLKGWERLFVATLQKCPKPGTRQLAKLEEIAARLGLADGGGADE